jgi:hypothetical protein
VTAQEAFELSGLNIPAGWEFTEIKRLGKVCGFICTKESEVHCWRMSDMSGKWFTRQDVERLLVPMLIEYGEITTKVMRLNSAGHQFVQRLGFVKIGDDGTSIIYNCKRLKHARY